MLVRLVMFIRLHIHSVSVTCLDYCVEIKSNNICDKITDLADIPQKPQRQATIKFSYNQVRSSTLSVYFYTIINSILLHFH